MLSKRRILDLLRVSPRLECWLMQWRHHDRMRIGRKSFVHRSVQVLGERNVMVGDNSVLSQDTWLNVNHRSSDGVAIRIDNDCFIGRRNFFSSGRAVHVKSFVLTANDCHFLGSTHIVDDPMRPVIATGTTATDTIVVGANSFIGAGARIIGNVHIGHGCVVGAGSTVVDDVPPFSLAVGSPARVRRRFSVPKAAWVPASEFSSADAAAIPPETEYIRHLKTFGHHRMPYIAAGSDLGNC